MELRQLQQFVVLAETLNFRQAAEQLHISQPPLSVSIRKLEEDLGVALFERSTRQVNLTEAGRAVLPEFRKALFHIQQARRHAVEADSGSRGELSIGSVGSATISLIPRIAPRFRQRYPGIALRLVEQPSSKVLDMVERGDLDLGLVRYPFVCAPKLQMVALEWDRLVVALPSNSPLIGDQQTSIDLDQLADQPVIAYAPTEGLHHVVLQLCQKAGFIPRLEHSTSQIQAAISMVAGGLGITLLPAMHARNKVKGVRFLELSSPFQERMTGLALVYDPDNESSLARQFRESAIEILGADLQE